MCGTYPTDTAMGAAAALQDEILVCVWRRMMCGQYEVRITLPREDFILKESIMQERELRL